VKVLLPIALAALASGCAIFSPYDNEFMCSATDDYGQCIDVGGAYDDALAGRKSRGAQSVPKSPEAPAPDTASRSEYKAAEYRELRKLLEAPVTPLVKPPKVLRTLVMAYPSGDGTLYTPRYVFFFADEGGFVLGDYLNATPPETATETLSPLGAP
jgi:conjugal transfer pilus assembly protein TraV